MERAHPQPQRAQRIFRKKDLPAITGLRRTAIDEAIRRGAFPRPIQLGPRAVGWLESAIVAWQQQRPTVIKTAASMIADQHNAEIRADKSGYGHD